MFCCKIFSMPSSRSWCGRTYRSALMESGIPLARGFWQEFFGRLRHKLLPPLQDENDFLYVLNRVFFRQS